MPQSFAILTLQWDVPIPLARSWWAALASSEWTVPCTWRQQILLFDASGLGDLDHFLHQVCGPQNLVAVLEALTQERRLSREHATTIEECLLARADHTGAWRTT
jgi:hypothetical protein